MLAMGGVQTPELVKEALDFAFSDSVPIQDSHQLPMSLANNTIARSSLWEWVKQNWEVVSARLGGNTLVISRFVNMTLRKFSTADTEKEIETFFEGKDVSAFARSLVVVKDTVRQNSAYRERDEALILEWLKANGYA